MKESQKETRDLSSLQLEHFRRFKISGNLSSKKPLFGQDDQKFGFKNVFR